MKHQVVSHAEWIAARKELLPREKELTALQDELSRRRRELPWLRVETDYRFATEQGEKSLRELFAGKRQLLVYHFMFAPDGAPCKSCSFWAEHLAGAIPHLAQRDATLIAISRAPLEQLLAFRRRLGWTFPWVSSFGSDFNYDFGVSFTPEQLASGEIPYNFGSHKAHSSEMPGISAFYRDEEDNVYRTYSCYARGVEALNTTYHCLDLLPKGRDERGLPFPMAWLSYRDEYPRTASER